MAERKLSGPQRAVLGGMDRLGAYCTRTVTAAEIAAETWRTPDGVAYTLRSLVRRQLVERGGNDGQRWGYRLTDAGLAETRSQSST